MFSLPPLPPKDYTLRDVNQSQKSSQEFTPDRLPRITQTNLGVFCAPLQYQPNEKLTNVDAKFPVNSQLLEKWTDQAKAFWVDKPGKNDYFLHEMCKKYGSQEVWNYDVRYKCNERVFYRPFMYELDCAKTQRLEKLHKKIEKEENIERKKQDAVDKAKAKEEQKRKVDTMGVKSCGEDKPFWWKIDTNTNINVKEKSDNSKIENIAVSHLGKSRWQEEPTLVNRAKKNCCQRRFEMAEVGMPFRNEACKWYYKNYPPPSHYKPNKFSDTV